MSGDIRVRNRPTDAEFKENASMWNAHQQNQRYINLTVFTLPTFTLCSTLSPLIYFQHDNCSHRPMRIAMIIINLASYFFCYYALYLSVSSPNTLFRERPCLTWAYTAGAGLSILTTGVTILAIMVEIIGLYQAECKF